MSLRTKRSLKSFFEVKLANKKEGTRTAYQYAFKDFEKFCLKLDPPRKMEQIVDEMKIADVEDVIDTIQHWINTSTTKGNNMRCRVTQLNKYLRYRKIRIDSMDMKDLEYRNGVSEERVAVQLDDLQRICERAQPKRKTLYITLACTGMTVGEACQIRKSDLDFTQSRIIIDIKPKYTKKDSRPRKVFVSKEAERHLKRYLDKMDDNDLIFGESENPKLAIASEQMSFRRTVDLLGLGRKYDTGTRHITLHALRAYFFTKAMQKYDLAYANRLTGHTGNNEVYARWTDEKKLAMFIDLEPELFVFMRKPETEEIISLRNKLESVEQKVGVQQKTLLYLDAKDEEKKDKLHRDLVKYCLDNSDAVKMSTKELEDILNKQGNLSS